MIYLTNDTLDQAVYFELMKSDTFRKVPGGERRYHGVLGNGTSEVPVTVRQRRDSVEMDFGRGNIFSFVEERVIRKMLADAVREMAVH